MNPSVISRLAGPVRLLVSASLLLTSFVPLMPPTCPSGPDAFVPTGGMTANRGVFPTFSLTRLSDGRVLAAGGAADASGPSLRSAELYDPTTGRWTATQDMLDPRSLHNATLLNDGTVLVSGGASTSAGAEGQATAEIYDPLTGIWTATGPLNLARNIGNATALLPNGRVLMAGGTPVQMNINALRDAEIYDPATGLWTITGSMTLPRSSGNSSFPLIPLPDGQVLEAGGWLNNDPASAELYNPVSGTWTRTGSMAQRRLTAFSLALLASGKVLAAGGFITNDGHTATERAELFDSATGQWTATTPLPAPRAWHATALLGCSKVLLAGGEIAPSAGVAPIETDSALLYDPSSECWTATSGRMTTARVSPGAVTLLDGRVVLVGGAVDAAFSSTTSSAELYIPGSGCERASTPTPTTTPTSSLSSMPDRRPPSKLR